MSRTIMQDKDREEVATFIEARWGSQVIMSSGKSYRPHQEEAFVERRDGQIVGLVTFRSDDGGIEVLTLNATPAGQRIGSSLMLALIDEARARDCRRIWLTTTNDNLSAVGFHQRLGFRVLAVNVGAVDEARKIKPEILEFGPDGTGIHAEFVRQLIRKPYTDCIGLGGGGAVGTPCNLLQDHR